MGNPVLLRSGWLGRWVPSMDGTSALGRLLQGRALPHSWLTPSRHRNLETWETTAEPALHVGGFIQQGVVSRWSGVLPTRRTLSMAAKVPKEGGTQHKHIPTADFRAYGSGESL